jgi:hypothetical protein
VLEIEAQPAAPASEAYGAELASVRIYPITLDAEDAGELPGVEIPRQRSLMVLEEDLRDASGDRLDLPRVQAHRLPGPRVRRATWAQWVMRARAIGT